MPLSQSTRPNRHPPKKGGEAELQSSAPTNRQGRFGNTFLQHLVGQAVQQTKGQGMLDTKLSFGIEEEPEGKYHFPEDGGTSTQSGSPEKKKQQDALPQLREKHQGGAYQYGQIGRAHV